MRTEILTFIVSVTICLIGAVALGAYALRSRSNERDLLWIGLFAMLYGTDLVSRNPLFQLGFGSTHELRYNARCHRSSANRLLIGAPSRHDDLHPSTLAG